MGARDMHPRQVPCWITHTNERTHDIIRGGLDRSPMFTGVIEGVGPRYCPSIEDKIHRFAGKASHQIFLEPEGLTTQRDLSERHLDQPAVRRAAGAGALDRGLENAHILRPGYAIEYDYFDPRGLKARSRPRRIEGLFFAGPDQRHHRLRGSGGAGSARRHQRARCARRRREAWCPRRDEAYLGVLVDDLMTRGVSEPYRMFTSRAEYRLQLREDNADLRLTEIGRELGLVDDARWEAFCAKARCGRAEMERLQRHLGQSATYRRTISSAFSGRRWSANTRSPICCAGRMSTYARC